MLDKTVRERCTGLLQEVYDRALLVQREAWRMFHAAENADKAELRVNLLGRIVSSLNVLGRFVPDLQSLEMQEQLDDLIRRQRLIDKNWQERKLATRVLPLQ
jgi:hypothetical protein